MVQVVDIPSGAQSGKIYLVNYDEDLWFKFDDEGRQFCKDTWIRKATPIPDVRFVVLKLHPDDLFPMHGKEKPYVEWQFEIDRPPECGFAIATTVTVTVEGDAKYVDTVMRMEITKSLSGLMAGVAFVIQNKRGDVIERGKL